MINLTVKEKEVLYLKQVECLTQDDIADKLNYSTRQVQRIQKSAENKIISYYVSNNIKEDLFCSKP